MQFFHVLCLTLIGLPWQSVALAQELRISHQWPEGDGRDRAARVFVQEAHARASSLKFRIYANSALKIAPNEQLEALQNNTLELAIFPLSYVVAKVPEFSLARLPGLVPNLNAAHALKGTEIYGTLQSVAEANGVRIITWWWSPGGFFSRSREIADPKSVQGLRMRSAEPLFDEMLKDSGASIADMPSTKLYEALKSESIDAFGTTYEAYLSFRLYEQTKYATIGSPSLFMGFSPMVMSRKVWEGLTAEQQAAVNDAAAISDAYYDAAQRNVERQVVATLSKAGVTIRRLSNEEYLQWLELAQRTAWLEYMKLNPRARELLVSTVRTFLDLQGPANELGDNVQRGGPLDHLPPAEAKGDPK